VIRHKWVTNVHETGQFGFIVAEELLDGAAHDTPSSGAGVIAVAEHSDGVRHGTPVSGDGGIVVAAQVDGVTHGIPVSGAGGIVLAERRDGATQCTAASGAGVIAVAEHFDGVPHATPVSGDGGIAVAEQVAGVTHGIPISGAGGIVVAERLDALTQCTQASGLGLIVAEEKLDGVTHGTPASGTLPGAENSHLHIPAVAVALVAPGRHRLNIADRTSLHAVFGVSLKKKPANMGACKEVEVVLFEKVMSGHPLLPRYLQLLEDWHKAEAARNRRRKQKDPTKAGLCVSIVGVCFGLVPPGMFVHSFVRFQHQLVVIR
jgi:hypothetical protein